MSSPPKPGIKKFRKMSVILFDRSRTVVPGQGDAVLLAAVRREFLCRAATLDSGGVDI
jgi:hypothetical protein